MNDQVNTIESSLNFENEIEILSYIDSGIVCYAFSLIDELGIINNIQSCDGLPVAELRSFPNPLVLQAACQTLIKRGILQEYKANLYLTHKGKALCRHRGSIGLIYNGYRHVLAHQALIARDEPSTCHGSMVDSLAVAKASVAFGEPYIINMILQEIRSLDTTKAICDLGCGNASQLNRLVQETGLHGIGFDISEDAIAEARKLICDSHKIDLQRQDITKICGIYDEVGVLIQSFVMHDLPDQICETVLKSFHRTFPSLNVFLYIDAVAPANGENSMLPGFDYIHSLLGIRTRDRQQTLSIFDRADFKVLKEIEIPGLVNCYMWALVTKKKRKYSGSFQ